MEKYIRCAQFGFDSNRIKQRLSFLKLSKSDHQLARQLHQQVIVPHVDRIIERFYETLLFHPESRPWLLDGETIERLKTTQARYLLSLGIDFDKEDYFEYRLQVGIMHAVVGLPLSTYQCAFSNLAQHILDAFPDSIQDNVRLCHALVNFVIKIISLDMSLATETYHYSFMSELEDEVNIAHTREVKLQSEAEADPLTGLFNRKYVFSHLNEAIATAHQYDEGLCLLMLDIDHFKNVNDVHGHQAGDEVIRQVAIKISETLRDRDIVGRYGGEEFVVGLVGILPDVALQVAERIRQAIANSVIVSAQQHINITISIGLACLRPKDDLQVLIKRADEALYAAKGAGRNCVLSN